MARASVKMGVGALIFAAAVMVLDAATVTLPVTVLPTGFGLPDEPAPTYPATINVEAPPELQLSAYGAAGQVWLAPRSWTGAGAVGADGNMVVQLYPAGNDGTSGPHITYTVISACVGCMLSSAAPYFPDALKEWNDEYNRDGKNSVAVPRGLTVTTVTSGVVTYALANGGDLPVRGAAAYDHGKVEGYEEIRVTLPPEDGRLAEFLLKYFVDHVGQDCSPRAACR
ncbi:MAG TPA: DUF4850 domain-containing protein [Vicinamibacterales bacterium]|nr:DUF4850 domain-containing protein [Vicinamibacterales bacterium]